MNRLTQSINREGSGYHLHQEQSVEEQLDDVFEFFSDPYNLETLTPDRLQFNVLQCEPNPIKEGTEIDYELKIWGIPVNWTSKISRWNPPNEFRDEMMRGPYKTWEHTHTFKRRESDTLIVDDVYYELPLGLPGRLAAGFVVKWDVASIFRHRANRMDDIF